MNKKDDDQLAKLLRKKRWNKKDIDRLEPLLAEIESKARSESEDRRARINVLWDLDERQLRAAKNPKERKLKEQELKEKKFTELLKSVSESTGNDDLVDRVSELIELVGFQDREIEYLTQFRRELEQIRNHDPEQLKNLSTASGIAALQPLIKNELAKEKPNTAWERNRSDYKRCGGVGLIEYEFGGKGEAEWRKSLCGLAHESLGGPPYQPTCLDEIFAGGTVHMPRLQLLFGMHRNRFPKNLARFKNPRSRREILYDYRAVTKIMEALLKRPERKTSLRGAPRRVWLSKATVRTRALSGIAKRIAEISREDEITVAFLTVLLPYLPHSAKE